MSRDLLFSLAVAGGFALAAAVFAFVYARGLALLQFYQQEEYDTGRFFAWLFRRRAFDKKATLMLLAAIVAWFAFARFTPALFNLAFYAVLFAALGLAAVSGWRLTRRAKKPLIMTARANRIFYVYMVLVAFYFAAALAHEDAIYRDVPMLAAVFLAFFQAPPFFLAAANFVLKPYEERVNRRYLHEAEARLKALSPVVVGVTGSYGKTTTKHILAYVLSAAAPALATPGSINTELGITRVIREELQARHKYFVAEMGAYGEGAIAKLCRLARPSLGLITAVGLAHLERFGTPEAVFRAKFELADGVKARGGKTIVNADAVPAALLKAYAASNPDLVLCGQEGGPFPLKVALVSARQTPVGIEIKLKTGTGILDLAAPLYGEHNAANVMMAAAAALELGLKGEVIRAALKTVPQIPHRLEVIQNPKGATVIDDAYNSNPQGFENALKVLSAVTPKGGRRILVTPGMVELGPAHEAEHERLGRLAAEHVDIALMVGPKRLASFIRAFSDAKPAGAELYTFTTQREAEAWARAHAKPDDAILFENNLPDLYEAVIEF
ncbi:MAG TPA: UDP-N-acetylmuramoyl-tripeptide--D-alanyl-D-alanine ligase [Sphingomonadales bacterium]|nr:UDP-N-acetylmuramoyl-tripeptide--D-alanyl-D-alanine ligase [Sphingomonadales bacterium]